jgi:hypothetical protein
MVGIDPDNRKFLNPPHVVGKEWSQSHTYRIPGVNRTLQRTIYFKVMGEETITTAAGTFQVFRIDGDARMGTTDQKWVYYYSEKIGVTVKWFYDSGVGEKGAKVEIEYIGEQ